MNVYDFDKTIYDGDSTIDFYFYCLKKHPKIILCLPIQLYAAVIPDIDMELNCFWDKNGYRIKEWYKNQKRENDVIISASPEFLLNGICKRIGVNNLIASQVDKRTGKYIGVNCYGKEKTRRFYQKYQYEIIDEFYSDSYSDEPMAKLAKKSFIVSKDIIKKW